MVAILHLALWVTFLASIDKQYFYINNGDLYIIYICIIYAHMHICNIYDSDMASFSMGDILRLK